MRRLRGSTSQRRFIFIADTSSTTGAGLANLAHDSSGLVAYYIAGDLSNEVQITLVSGTLGTYVSGGFVAVDNTNMPGWYEVGIPDAALDGGNQVAIQYRGAANMAPVNIYIDLDAVDYQTDAFGALKPTTAGRTLDVTATGAAGIDLANVENQGSTLNLSATSIKTATDVETDTQDIQTRLPAALIDGRMVSLAQEVTDKSGYTLTQAFPSNFEDLGIDSNGVILSVAFVSTVDELGANALTANGAGDYIAGYVWDEPYNLHTQAGTFGKLLDVIRKSNTVIEGTVTSAVSPTATTFTSNVNYPTGAFKHAVLLFLTGNLAEQNSPILTYTNANGAIVVEEAFTSAPQTGDEFIIIPTTHVHSVAAIAQGVAATQVMSDLATMIINDGTVNARYSVSALQNGPSGAGGSTINVYPVSASTPERVAGTTITYYRDENRAVSVVTDFVLDALTLEFVVEDSEGTDLLVIADGSISKSNKTFTVTIGTTVTATISNYRWSLRDLTGGSNSVIARGVLSVQEAASNG